MVNIPLLTGMFLFVGSENYAGVGIEGEIAVGIMVGIINRESHGKLAAGISFAGNHIGNTVATFLTALPRAQDRVWHILP